MFKYIYNLSYSNDDIGLGKKYFKILNKCS